MQALRLVDKNDKRFYEAELPRIKGTLTLQSQVAEAEECFLKAIEIAQRQQAKSLELRVVMSLVRLRQQQVTQPESRTNLDAAHKMLANVQHWFTEVDPKELCAANVL